MYISLCICTFLTSPPLAEAVQEVLNRDRYRVITAYSDDDFYAIINAEKPNLDCLILQTGGSLPAIATWLYGQAILLPALILHEALDDRRSTDILAPPTDSETAPSPSAFIYHTAEVQASTAHLKDLEGYIDRAIAQFIHLSPTCRVSHTTANQTADPAQTEIAPQQQRLTEKLRERLGYLSVYYKRNPKNFFRHLTGREKDELLDQLKADYREIILRYFENDTTLNDRIDTLVNTAFFSDIAVSQLVEIHMELMDEFAKQLKLEGRSGEILLDYRLTLIDTIAHLCEMYRRSIPRETE